MKDSVLIVQRRTPVNLDVFRILSPGKATGADQNVLRLTNLKSLNVDTSWYFQYRSTQNPDLGASFPQLLEICEEIAIAADEVQRGAQGK